MHGRIRRMIVSTFAVALAIGLSSCSSNNEGSIVGRWEATSGPLVDKFKASLPKADDPKARVTCMIEFNQAGEFAMGWRVTNLFVPLMSGKYKLGQGDVVEFHELKINKGAGELANQPNLTVKIAIAGDTLTFSDSSGDTKFQKMQQPAIPAAIAAPVPTTAKQ